MIVEEIRKELFRLKDEEYRDFQGALLPTVDRDSFIGVRTPELRAMAKTFASDREIEFFLSDLPHAYFDENQLHAFLLCEIKDFSVCIDKVERFLPYVDNWATCDQLSPKVFKKHRKELLPAIRRFLSSDRPFTVRFGVGMLMRHFSDEEFSPVFLEEVATIRSEEYYVNMMVAWFFATELAKHYEEAFPYLAEGRLPPWTHNKTIQKALESYRIPLERKRELRGVKRILR